MMNIQQTARAYADFFESVSQATPIESYAKLFDSQVFFEDPFQKVSGVDKVYDIFQHMFKTLYAPHFIVNEIVCNEQCAYLHWTFSYQRSAQHQTERFTGISRVQFLETGKVLSHVDYWDAGENIYEKVPLLGSVLRLIKKKIKA